MNKWILLLAALLLTMICQAQTRITGKITDQKKRPVGGVSVGIKDSYDGATSDSAGNFRFMTSEKGTRVLVVSSVGYKPVEIPVELNDKDIEIDIPVREEVSELKAVVISAGTFEASDKKKTTVLNPIDIVTTASGNADVTGALKTLPGAQQVGESEGLFVRGGTAAETKTFIDGTLVNNFFYSSVPNIAQRGRFSPFIFKGTVFSTGGYSALYGQALSSALILESIDLPEQTAANLGVSVIGLSGGYQHLAKNKKSSWGVSYGYTDLWLAFLLNKQRQQYDKAPVFHTADANFRIKTSKTGMLKYYGYFSANDMNFTTPSLDSLGYFDRFSLNNLNFYHNISLRENLGKKWKLNTGLSYTNNRDRIAGAVQDDNGTDKILQGLEFKTFRLTQKGNYINGRVVTERRFAGLNMIRFGGEYNFSEDETDYTSYNNQLFKRSVKEHIKAGFAETDIYITNNIAAKIGARYEHSSLLNRSNLAPRVSVAYKTGKQSQASVAYGIFYQNPETRYLPGSPSLLFSKATHYIAQYQKVTGLITFRTEIFYKKYEDLVKTSTSNGTESAINNNGYGDAKGFELFWRDKKNIKDVDYWISYSFLDTKRDFLNFPMAIQPSFAAKHTASLVMKKFVTNWKTQFNIAYNYASKRPYYLIVNNPNNGKPEFFDRGTTPDYHNVSLSLNYLPSIGKKNARIFPVYVLSVSNVFGFNQIFGYQYSYNGFRKQAIVPPSRVFVFIGAFISFGVDQTENAINVNL